MPKVRAWERLHDPKYCVDLSMAEVYELMVEAGYSEAAARAAANERGHQRLNAGQEM